MSFTRLASPVFFGPMTGSGVPLFTSYEIEKTSGIVAEPFKSMRNPDVKVIYNVLKGLYREHRKQHESSKSDASRDTAKNQRSSRADEINRKREVVAAVLKNQNIVNFRLACKMTGCSYEMVRAVHRDLQMDGAPSSYEYPNEKSASEIALFNISLNSLQGTYQTIADLKRQNPSCSRKWIARRLKLRGFKWRQLRRQRKNPKKEKPNHKRVVEVICHMVQAHNSPNCKTIFIDEAHFPLYQTSDHRWTLGLHQDDLVYNRRPVEERKLSVIAACDVRGFIAMQVFVRDITKEDFLYYLQKLLQRCERGQRVTVLADNATWHTSSAVVDTTAGQFLYFNVPGLFRVNAIENCFSFVRSEFRKRPLVGSLEEEAKLLVNIFFHRDNEKRFIGVHKNHLRQMLLLLRDNSCVLRHIPDQLLLDL